MIVQKICSLIILILFITGCGNWSLNNRDKAIYDDELIALIQNADNKVNIEFNDLPLNILSTLQNEYYENIFLTEQLAPDLGYELLLSTIEIDEESSNRIYFNMEGRKLVRKRDEGKQSYNCFDLVFPITFEMPDGTNIVVESDDEDGWQNFKDWYETYFESDDRPTIYYPVDIVYIDGNTVTINDEEEMTDAKNNCIYCFALIFPITFVLPENINITVQTNDESGWQELKAWFESNAEYEFDWNYLQYPIDINLEDQTTVTLNNAEEMWVIKQNCN